MLTKDVSQPGVQAGTPLNSLLGCDTMSHSLNVLRQLPGAYKDHGVRLDRLLKKSYFVRKVCHTREGRYPEVSENTGFPFSREWRLEADIEFFNSLLIIDICLE